jgi:hypothetical protein
MLSIPVDYFQILSFSFSTEDLLFWEFPQLQRILFLLVAPWPLNNTTFYIAFAFVVILLLLLLTLFYQVYVTRGIRSLYILKGGRILISLFGTVLFFPMVEICVAFMKKLVFKGFLSQEVLIDNELYKDLALVVLALIFFILPVSLFTYLCFSPDPLDNQDALAKITTRPEILDLLGRGIIVLNSNFTTKMILRVWIHFFILLSISVLHIVYPSYINPKLSYLRAFLICSALWVSALAIQVGTVMQKDNLLAIVALAGIPVWGSLGAAAVRLRFETLNIIKWLDTSARAYRGPSLSEKQLEFLKHSVEHFITTRCFLSTDIEVASRFCSQFEEVLVGRILFEKGMAKFPQSSYLKCRYAMYLVYVASPGAELKSKNGHRGMNSSLRDFLPTKLSASSITESKLRPKGDPSTNNTTLMRLRGWS